CPQSTVASLPITRRTPRPTLFPYTTLFRSLRGEPKQLGRAAEILGKLLPLHVEQPEIVGGGRMTELRRGGEQARCLAVIARAAASADAEHGEREHRLAVAALGRELVPAHRLRIVVGHAEAIGVKPG